MKLVIPCAGRGVRLGGATPKTLVKVNGRSLLGWITWNWSDVVDSYVIIVSPQNERQIKGHLKEVESGIEFVTQPAPVGLADAILCAEPYVKGKFIINLGDCLSKGTFDETPLSLGIGVWPTYDTYEINKSYLVDINERVTRLTEKPNVPPKKQWPPYACGMGVYFLDNRVFKYIRNAQSGEDFTGVLQTMINKGEEIKPVIFRGDYINVTYPQDIKTAEEIFK